MNSMVFVTNLLGGAIFFQGFSLGGGSVLVSAADVDSVVTAKTTVTSKDISTQNTSNDVAEMRDVIDVRQGAGDEDVALSLEGKLRSFGILRH